MNNQTITLLEKHFDVAFAAPSGIKKLRELILTLAMQGKLVPQDPSDQPVSELLKEIEAEKKRLVREGKIKQPKSLPEIKSEEVPSELPEGWEWLRLGDFGIWKSGTTPSRANNAYYGGEIPWVKSGEVKQRKIRETEEKITHEALEDCSLELNPIGSILIAMYGANIGEVGVLEIEATTNQAVCACKTYLGIDNIFLLHLIISLKQNFIAQGAGAAQPNISREKIVNTVASLPPLAEQHRIVAKIDQLMVRCDELEKLRAEWEQKRITFHTAALNRLLMSTESNDFSTAWRFITQHFSELYSVKENVAELRKAILQLAVMGKLVPQDPKDQPASKLLKAIEVEKQRMVKEGKIKQPKPLPEIKPEEVPYELPKGWEWVRVIDIVDVGTGSTPATTNSEYYNGTIPWYTSSATNNSIAEIPETFITESAIRETNCKIFPSESLIIAMYGQGKTRGQISEIVIPGATNQAIAAMVFYESSRDIKHYIKYYFVKIYDEIRSIAEGAAQPNLNVGKIKETLIPLPPLAEQNRIVGKIDQLMSLCDHLEQEINATTGKRSALLNALLAQV
jgi:type I restriction enzyme, S subunit